MTKIPLSVLVILKFQDEFFFIVRQNHLRVFPGYCSFPGGKANKVEDEVPYQDLDPNLLGVAARELEEELGFDLKKKIAAGAIKDILHIGQAITPDFNPYRFEAQYFLVELNERPDFKLCRNEIKEAFWMSSEAMKKRFGRGDLIVIPPMWNILEAIENGEYVHQSFDLLTPEKEVPCLESIYGVKQYMPLSNTLPPAQRTNAFLIGDILIDPSPRDEKEYRKLLNSLPKNSVKKILITHHHGDHHHLSRELALELGCDILCSPYTLKRILESAGEDFFDAIEVRTVSQDEAVAEWLDEKVLIYEVPGHDEGQIALAPSSLRWFIAGDLFQGVGTVVIGGDEGDMAKYFKTLRRVIELAPKALYPSHGIVLGGCAILEKTLAHRKLREDQIKEMALEGLTDMEMLQRIYFDLPRGLHKYALANIHSHLKKLRGEGLV